MKVSNTAERLKKLMSDKGIRQTDVLDMCKPFCDKYGVKLGKNDISQYLSGKVEPGSKKLTILGHALEVDEVWLMGYDVPMERQKSEAAEEKRESSDEARLLALYRSLNEEGRASLMKQAELHASADIYKAKEKEKKSS